MQILVEKTGFLQDPKRAGACGLNLPKEPCRDS
jgi:hypothetical protein